MGIVEIEAAGKKALEQFPAVKRAAKRVYQVASVVTDKNKVKAEGNIRSQSLRAFHDKYKPNLSVRFSALNYADQEWMINIPLYAVCNV